jgi:hypothetical protein
MTAEGLTRRMRPLSSIMEVGNVVDLSIRSVDFYICVGDCMGIRLVRPSAVNINCFHWMSGKTLEIFIHKDRRRNVVCIHYTYSSIGHAHGHAHGYAVLNLVLLVVVRPCVYTLCVQLYLYNTNQCRDISGSVKKWIIIPRTKFFFIFFFWNTPLETSIDKRTRSRSIYSVTFRYPHTLLNFVPLARGTRTSAAARSFQSQRGTSSIVGRQQESMWVSVLINKFVALKCV